MFETVEIGSKVAKADFKERVAQLRVDLINAQYELQRADFSVIVMLVGDDRLGASDALDRLHEWMDARYIDTHVFADKTQEELERPRAWATWRALPPRGRIGILFGGWALRSLGQYVDGTVDEAGFSDMLIHMRRMEEMLAEDGTLILKFWVHLDKKTLKKRLKKADKDGQPLEDADWEVCKRIDELLPVAQRLIRETDTEHSRWTLVEGTDPRHRDLTVCETIRDALNERLEHFANAEPRPAPVPATDTPRERSVLDGVDLGSTLDDDEYVARLAELQTSIAHLTREARHKELASVLAFEGWDAAGKGGVIRRLTGPMAPRDYRIVPIAAPTDEELAHHYLWRFWRQLPRAGRMLIFDRSWYGRVLVERVEGFATPPEWQRAYEEINDFEKQLVEHGMLVRKYWLHISPEEQLARFEARAKTPYKKYKLTDEDYRNRDKWPLYVAAIDEMVARTSTDLVPWVLVPANDKKFARITVLADVEAGLKRLLG